MVHKFQIEEIKPSVSRLKSVVSQVTACMSPNLLLMDLGMALGFTTIMIPALLNAPEGLSLNDTEASWIGSLSYLTQPIGALISGPLVNYYGRKKSNFLVNIPHLVAWILMYYSWNLPSIFIANALLGLGTGVMEAPINSYVGEVSEPSIRGALCTVTQLFTSIGILAMYFLGTVVDWRTAALITLAVPIISMIFVLLAPETPVWLLSQGKQKEALKSLCYLRGWTSAENVKDEYDDLCSYTKNLDNCVICEKTNQDKSECHHENMNYIKKTILKFRYVMFSKETLRPLCLVILYFMFYVMSGFNAIRPNMVNICGAFGMPGDGKNIALMVGIITFITAVIVVGMIKMLGKRKIAIAAMLGTGLSTAGLSIYAAYRLDNSVFSYDTSTFPEETSYVPLILFYSFVTFTGFGIPWVLLGEVFPFRSRATSQGISAALNYVVMFFGAKTFITLETYVKLSGTFAVYAIFAFVGTIYLYIFLPETEGKSLLEIESFYKGEFRTFADDPCINSIKRCRKKT